jgi:hypothetical protein
MGERWDVVSAADGVVILNASWPKDRGLFFCEDPDGETSSAFVFDDCEGDAVVSMADHNDHEGDDERILVRSVTSDERELVRDLVCKWYAEQDLGDPGFRRRTPDRRYVVRREASGDPTKPYVARFCDKWLGSAATRDAAIDLCDTHAART